MPEVPPNPIGQAQSLASWLRQVAVQLSLPARR